MAGPPTQPGANDGANLPDPPTRNASQSPPREELCCIYVHAGAGYHSIQNETIHLEACQDAASAAMLILRNGGSALDAVEMAVRILEDREITNAGFGSNLSMDGVVECDASIVDHHGRSGAVGAAAQIKNPVSLARLVLNHSMQTLTLRRVPPNLLVSQGAINFAVEMGMPILPHDALVSPGARERWIRWRADLKTAERKSRKNGNPPQCWRILDDAPDVEEERLRERMRIQHTQNLSQGYIVVDSSMSTPLEGNQSANSDPSGPSDPVSETSTSSWPSEGREPTPDSVLSDRVLEPTPAQPRTIKESSRNAFINSTQKVPTIQNNHPHGDVDMSGIDRVPNHLQGAFTSRISARDGSEESGSASSATMTPGISDTPPTRPPARPPVRPLPETSPSKSSHERDDNITDTVGAIAVDKWGKIACAASSGGIGMKYRGRVGPAALVGVGTAVLPADPNDPERTSVAVVTSGTGEHMATTMAATVCAERLYHQVKKGRGGAYEDANEDAALGAMIENEFMGHPSVKNSNSAGAIGILAIKSTSYGTFLYYGHNTDSFAMASMHSEESVPWCAMSRTRGGGQIAQGGRSLKLRSHKKMRSTTTQR